MAVVSEPPWLNRVAGTAPKNASTSHTINFGFTSASGSLLVAIVHGAVTNTASGWTKQAGPVATGECALLTKTSAGDTSITVTHNGSDYAVNYVIYEFPAGSSLTGIDSTTGTSDTLVGLTGLPGTEQVTIAAIGRVAVGSESGASATWSPLVEDADLFVAAAGTDGGYLTVGHEINVTATSWSPSTSISYTGTWGNNQREKISAAFNVATAATNHTRTVDDPAGLADAGLPLLGRTVTDAAGIADSQGRTLGPAITDLAGTADTTAPTVGRTLTDPAVTGDQAGPALTRPVSDNAGLTDAASTLLFTLIVRTVNDTTGHGDLGAPQALDIAETLTDSAGSTDSVNTQLAGAGTRLIDDPAGLSDSVVRAIGVARAASDVAALTDNVDVQLTASSAHVRTVSDSMGLRSTHRLKQVTCRPYAGVTSRYPLVPD